MSKFLRVLPQRDEIGVTLTNGDFVEISQTDSTTGESDTIRIHIEDIPVLMEALSSAIDYAKAPF
ncbi:TPA: hypothetical protein I8438_002296 [Serratia marcescens]|uniref:Uncharacterized protein n=1 Tax=Serratia marcescens TaxID=615 RepID=A0AB33G994_SERMA|nr:MULTISPECIES: hypothetical protein [Serratia]AKL43765.1 hypothetical protein AB188_26020 [Serratia marcescens]AWL71136.1 hypothetical protein DKC05_27550 [Serratia marcescens]MBH2842870.1 hypothetical protein [Serratia marcescens]MBH2861758.1 hypothetical protein [Serratia marcescens]MBH2977781.1 hypothetical protein [Serratia marcescens]